MEALKGEAFRETALAERLLGVLARLSGRRSAQEAIADSGFVDWAAKAREQQQFLIQNKKKKKKKMNSCLQTTCDVSKPAFASCVRCFDRAYYLTTAVVQQCGWHMTS